MCAEAYMYAKSCVLVRNVCTLKHMCWNVGVVICKLKRKYCSHKHYFFSAATVISSTAYTILNGELLLPVSCLMMHVCATTGAAHLKASAV
jgi:hypothetical protein